MSTFVLLKNSGFSHTDIPDSMATLTAAGANAVVDDNTIFIRQTRSLTQIKAKCTPSQASQVDYVIVEDSSKGGNTCYFIDGYDMTSPQTAVFSLSLDAVTTLNLFASGSSFGKLTGWVTQRTKSQSEIASDKQIEITMKDSFTPSENFEDHYFSNILGANTADSNHWFIGSSVDLMNITKKAAKYIDPESKEFVTVPELPIPSASTTFSIPGMRTWKLPHETIFDGAADGIGTALNTVRSLGVESAISSSYVVSDIYCATGASGGAYSNLEGAMKTVSTGASTNPDGVSVENKKALYALTKITLSSMVSGDSADFSVAQLGNDLSVTFFANLYRNGKPYCRFYKINGSTDPFFGTVQGNNWTQQPIGYSMQSGDSVKTHEYNMTARRGSLGLANSAVSLGAGAASASPISTGGGIVDLLTGGMGLKQASNQFDEHRNLAVPEVQFVNSGDMQDYIGNDFAIKVSVPTASDIARYDSYLHRYGEAVDEKFNVSLAHQNAHYDFIKLGDCSITNTSYPRYIVNLALAQLQGGIRVWHTQPTAAALEIGGN